MKWVLLGALGAALSYGGTLAREGAYWVRTDSGSMPAAGLHCKIKTSGAVHVSGIPGDTLTWTIRKLVRARSEAEARRVLERIASGAKSYPEGVFVGVLQKLPPSVSAETRVQAPQSTRAAYVYTDSGDVQIGGLRGSVQVQTGGGRIVADDIGGDASLRTGGGEIILGAIGGAVRSLSAGGSIEARSVGAESWFETAGGDIRVSEAAAQVHASTMGGNIQIGSAGSVWARTGAGLIEVQRARGLVTAGNSGGPIQVGYAHGVRCESSGGAIRLRGTTGALRAITDVGSISAELGGNAPLQDSLLSTAAGDITVLIPSNLPVTVRALNESGRVPRIVSDFPEIAIRPAGGASLAEGRLNGGGPILKISATSGTIYLRRHR